MSDTARILYLDDDPLQLRALRRALRDTDYRLQVFDQPLAALGYLSAHEVEVVLSDWRMPQIDGIDFLERVTMVQPGARRILVTGEREFGAAVQAINRVEVHRLVPKPWTKPEMLRVLAEMIDAVQITRDNTRLHRLIREKNEALCRLNEELERRVHERSRNVLDSLVHALDSRDTETQWHSRRVACYAVRLARELGVEGRELRDFEWGALLHDVGKIGIPDRILHKPAPLDADEWEIMKTHPTLGWEMLKDIDFLAGAATIVSHHRERWDGKGYPSGLGGEDICLGARVFAAIDAYDAMTSDRPYRKGTDHISALAEIQKVSGVQLDPRVVEAFGDVPSEEWVAIREEIGGWDYHGVFQTGPINIAHMKMAG